MKPPAIPPATIAAAAVGFLVMAALGWSLAGPSRASAAASPSAAEQARHSTRKRPARHSGPPEHVLQQMAAIRAAASPVDRMRATIELANSIPVSEIAAWLDGHWFNLPGGCEASVFRKILSDRWQQEDPEGMALHFFKQGSGAAFEMAYAWAKRDPRRVLAFFKEHPDPSLEMQMLSTVAESDPALALGRFKELLATGITADQNAALLQILAKSSPAELSALLDSMPLAWRNSAEAVLTAQRLKSSFAEEIRSLWDRPDGWQAFQRASGFGERGLGEQLLAELANLPASWRGNIAENPYQFLTGDSATKWWNTDLESIGFTAEQAGKIRQTAVQQLVYGKPEDALKLLVQTDFPESQRKNFIAQIFSQADTPEKSAAWLAQLGSDADRQQATAAMAAQAAAKARQQQPKIESPADWLTQVAATKPGDDGSTLYQLRQWDEQKIAELAAGFRALPDDQKTQVAKVLTSEIQSNSATPELTGEAVRYLVSHPEPGDPKSGNWTQNPAMQASVQAVTWAQKDPAAASAWVETLPAGTAQDWARKNLAANWAQVDPDATSQWIATLPPAARTQVNDYLKKNAASGH